jgi:hypothetical protein
MASEPTSTSPTDRSAPTPWGRIVRELRDAAEERGITGHELLQLLECRKQDLCDWASPTRREPPLWVIRRLLKRLDLVLVVAPEHVLVLPRREVFEADPD